MLKATFQTVRTLHTSLPRSLRNRRANPGVGYQVKVLETQEELTGDPEGFGELESDFMDLHKTHKQHEKELIQQRERIRHLMIKRKYFREEKSPNLLTYAEKEQIRLLHTRDPDEWTVERLAESFPATAGTVKKVLEAKWRPYSTKRILKHDEVVIRNWELLRSGSDEFHIPQELREHLKRFAARKREDLQTPVENWPTRPDIPKPKTQEFLSLITSCSKYADDENVGEQQRLPSGQHQTAASAKISHQDSQNETYLLSKIEDKRKMRLQDLKRYKLISLGEPAVDSAKLVDENKREQYPGEIFSNPEGTGRLSSTKDCIGSGMAKVNYATKFESNEIVISSEDRERFEITRIKDRIHIPRKDWRQGATYRVEDCYYDDDGEFLYRVPGMTGGQTESK